MKRALEAAFRLSCTLPSRVHRRPDAPGKGVGGPQVLFPDEKKRQILMLHSRGWSRRMIAGEVKVGLKRVIEILGPAERRGRPTGGRA